MIKNINKIQIIQQTLNNLNKLIEQPNLNFVKIKKLKQNIASLSPIINHYKQYQTLCTEKENNNKLMTNCDDKELIILLKEENTTLNKNIIKHEQQIQHLLINKNSDDQKNIILEIRSGTGGNEASLFAYTLFQMYSKFAEKKGFIVDIINISTNIKHGIKEVIAKISGNNAYLYFKYEAGIHRVQRIPNTETQGRIHTSTCTVAILPEAMDVDINIENKDIRLDVFRAGGPGGQSVNTTDSAVRITHIPTNISVQCQDEKSQIKNKSKAMMVLRSRIYKIKQEEMEKKRSNTRKNMIKGAKRSDKIRTYNFPQNRCTDHRISFTIYNLTKLLSGNIDILIDKLKNKIQHI